MPEVKESSELTTPGEHSGKVLDTVGAVDVIECEGCGFAHITPIPSDKELSEIYKEEYYTEEKPQFIDCVKEDLEWWNSVYNDRYDFLESVLSSGRRRILDIGCGPGYFLKRGVERGWNCSGVEPSRTAAEHAQGLGLDVKNAMLAEAALAESTFDAIHCSEVMEHIPDPLSFLTRAAALLKPDGIICCVAPNDYNPVQEILRDKLGYKPYWLAPPHHINYFTPDTLAGVLKNAGFGVVSRTAMFPMDFFLLMGDNYVGDDTVGRACHARRKKLDLLLGESKLKGFKKELYELMARHNVGREIVIYAQKEDRR
ncbi:Methyltransferase type 12 [hydrothermal vent metagenome]|uniref:Methyltransferase type 12 n=1 Tax=hydrothermal vent metagenome TaxID=652676 RepID=A0A3B0QZ47_9ZZZZ